MIKVDPDWPKKFKSDRNELNPSKLTSISQNQSRMAQNEQKWTKFG